MTKKNQKINGKKEGYWEDPTNKKLGYDVTHGIKKYKTRTINLQKGRGKKKELKLEVSDSYRYNHSLDLNRNCGIG